jgi:hypothetical protein
MRARARDSAARCSPRAAPPLPGTVCRVAAASTDTDILELTEQNVETVLDEVRPRGMSRCGMAGLASGRAAAEGRYGCGLFLSRPGGAARGF